MKEKKKNDKGLSTLEYLQMLQILHLSNNLQSEHSLLSSHRLMFKNNKTTKVWNPDEQFMQMVTLGVFILSVDSQTGWTAVKTALFHLQHFTLVFVVCPPPSPGSVEGALSSLSLHAAVSQVPFEPSTVLWKQ